MATEQSIPELTLARIALDLDAPTPPARIPPDAHKAVVVCEQYLQRCHVQLRLAQTREERALAQFWVINAERQLDKWQGLAERTVAR